MSKLLVIIIIVAFALGGCVKESVSEIDVEKASTPLRDPATDVPPQNTGRYYTGMVDLMTWPSGGYTNGSIIFDNIVHRTGTFQDGEAVESLVFHFDPTITSNVLWSSSTGPYFTYVQGTAIGGAYSPSFIASYRSFDSAFHKFLDSNFYKRNGSTFYTMPSIADFVPTTTTTGELVTSGVVVRRNSSATTFAVAPASFPPTIPVTGTPMDGILGEINTGAYIVVVHTSYPSVIPPNGSISYIEVFDLSYNPVSIKGFVASYVQRISPLTGFDIEGEMTMNDNSIVSISGVADGL